MRTPSPRTASAFRGEHLLLLKTLLMTVAIAVGGVAAWWTGALERILGADHTGISVGISALFLAAYLYGGCHLVRLSMKLNHFLAVRDAIVEVPRIALPPGCVSAYVKRLETKALIGGRAALDQRLLLETFEGRLRKGHGITWFIADVLLSLGLLGTVIGFISMLAPLAGLEVADHAAIKGAIAALSEGMAVALHTTLTGLIGGVLLRVQGLLLDGAVQDVLEGVIELTEVHVLPTIERSLGHATV